MLHDTRFADQAQRARLACGKMVAMRLCVAAAAMLIAAGSAPPALAQVEIAPFVGFQYGGALHCCPSGRSASIDVGLQYGATIDVPVWGRFGVELLFARQETELAGAPRVGFAVERYMAGVREEKEVGRARFLGVFLLGMTRFIPDGFDADERFSVALGLGMRMPLSRHFGVRADVRGYYAVVTTGGGIACVNGSCLFAFGGSGIWQGDVTAALMLTF
jgi:hypothetical protein